MKRPFVREVAPKMSIFAKNRERQGTKYYRFVHTIVVDVDDLIFSPNDPRADGIDPKHVEDLQLNLLTAGCEEDGELAAVKKSKEYPGKYDVIDQHHLVSAFKNIKQKKLNVDEYEYTGSYGDEHEWASATDFGLQINNNHLITKRTTMASVVHAGIKKIKTCDYIYEPGTPVNESTIREWIKVCKHDQIFSKGKVTEMVQKILHPTKLAGASIRPLCNEVIDTICASSGGNYGSGTLNAGYYGFIVKTDNFAADGPKGYNQFINVIKKGKTPCFITYSGRDDAEKIVANHEAYFDKMYETYEKHMESVEILHGIKFPLLTKKEFFAKLKAVAISQIEDEYCNGDDFVERPLNV